MKHECKKNNELTYEELEKLYDIFEENMKKVGKNTFYASFLNNAYKENWIKETLEDDNLLCITFHKSQKCAGFLFIINREDENYIREFQINKEFHEDGETFKHMVIVACKYLDSKKDITGNIWMTNAKARAVFTHLGARYKDDRFRISYENLQKWLNSTE